LSTPADVADLDLRRQLRDSLRVVEAAKRGEVERPSTGSEFKAALLKLRVSQNLVPHGPVNVPAELEHYLSGLGGDWVQELRKAELLLPKDSEARRLIESLGDVVRAGVAECMRLVEEEMGT
jgi:hypothetical protein